MVLMDQCNVVYILWLEKATKTNNDKFTSEMTSLILWQTKKTCHVALFLQAPTVFWLLESWENLNFYLDLTAITGMVLSVLIFVKGAGNALILFTLWILYHSLVNVGQSWFSFGWESQLLETGIIFNYQIDIY